MTPPAATTAPDRGGMASRRQRDWAVRMAAGHATTVAAVLLFLGFALTADVFASFGNLANIAKQMAPTLVIGLGLALVVLVGGIDLSVGSTVLLAATLGGAVLDSGAGSAAAVAVAVLAGAAVGLVNAILVEGLRISPVIVTLGTMIAVRGLALVALAAFNSWIWIKDPLFDWFAKGEIVGLPAAFAIAAVLAAAIAVTLGRTAFGRRVRAAGDNPVAAFVTGLPVRRLRAATYVLCGALAGAAGVLTAARTGVVSPSLGLGLEFLAIAVVALGAGGLPAGRVTVGQTIAGTLILTMVLNYMTIRGVPGTWQTTATGLLVLAAIVAGRLLRGRSVGDLHVAGTSAEIRSGHGWAALAERHAIAAATVAMLIVFTVINPRMLAGANLLAIVDQNAMLAVVAVGATIGIISRSIDVSPGSVVALGTVAAALAGHAGADPATAVLAGVVACCTVYALNGVLAGWLDLDPLILTLAAWIWARGLAVGLTDAQTIPFDPGYVAAINAPLGLGLTPAMLLPLAAFGLGWVVLARSALGVRIYALGHDPKMTRQAGIDVAALRLRIFLVMGLFTAAGMALMLGRLGAAAPTAGVGLELDAIVAVIIGGTPFQGGHGRLRNTVFGVAFLAILNNGLSQLQMGDAEYLLAKGSVILAALVLQALLGAVDRRQRA